ncbi:MAG: ClpXP protease specificity-enhancing factor [Gammaproteobacteria bacterium]|nr:ClpXP protease specificity-enhancing factor [Gammaproteobacteria bacterium]MBU1655272.1 ClpXP protease specificity-enhancing factor [Gammaproteobacteria bacterium]MBU1962051.1 ClpXP protease specificity-enhancing factor [Gammaproteobacteria bacterium]
MTSSRPYFIRALYDWLVDNGTTPYLLVKAQMPGVQVPAQFVENGQIVLNLSPTAVQALDLGNELIRFSARFGGVPMEVRVPPGAVLGIYARENGRGMLFPESEGTGVLDAESGGDEPNPPPTGGRPSLRVVK